MTNLTKYEIETHTEAVIYGAKIKKVPISLGVLQ